MDSLDGEDGGDEISGGADGDTLNGGPGVDGLDGGEGSDILNGDAGDDGTDTMDVTGGPGDDTVNGGADDDTLDGGENTTVADVDTLNGASGNDTLLNNDGPEVFNGDAHGAGGADTVDYTQTAAAPMTIDIDGNPDDGRNCPATCEGDNVTSSVENVTGDSSADVITGSGLANVLNGAGGNDTLVGGPGTATDGADRFLGGTGSADTASDATRADALIVDIDGAADDAGESDDVEIDVENLIGGTAGDTLTGGSAANDLRGGSGTGADTLSGGAGPDTLFGGTGTNAGADGADTFLDASGISEDRVSYGGRTDDITASIGGPLESGGDDVQGTIANLTGGSGEDTLFGDNDANVLNGGPAGDFLQGGAVSVPDGADTFIGGSVGEGDTVSYAHRDAPITADIDTAIGDDTGGDTISDDIQDLIGGGDDDSLTGNSAKNELFGGPGNGNDTLSGGDEDDRLFGGTGENTGPDGADTFVAGNQGSGGDLVSYSARTDPITASIGGAVDTDGDVIGAPVDNLLGGEADDILLGDGDQNDLFGNDGDDLLEGNTAATPDMLGGDSLNGGSHGPAGDTVTYASRSSSNAVIVDLDGSPDDGGVGENDKVGTDIENVTGGNAADTLTGDEEANALRGGPGTGDDTLFGLGGDDTLFGGTGANPGPDGADAFSAGNSLVVGDTVSYAGRTDPITASIADDGPADADGDSVPRQFDNLTGGDGDDDLTGDIDPNLIRGGLGNDHIDVTRGGLPDTADCGDGVDTALGDSAALDTLIACETSTFLETPPVVPPPASTPPTGSAIGASGGAATGASSGAAALKKCNKKKGKARKKCRRKAAKLAGAS